MANKYEKEFLDIASKLDAISESCGEITKNAIEIVKSKDENAIKLIVKKISDITTNNEYPREVKQIAKSLNNELVCFCGYEYIKNVCQRSISNNEDERSLEELLDELNNLVGLENVKSQVNDLIALQKVQKLRRERGFNSTKNTLHMAFLGNPGTGKTTVARIVGHIYKQIGLLSKGHFIEVSRTDLIAGYQGQTALKVQKVVEEAKGGVLFIDEAYSITENDHTDSYGRECLTELTKALEDYRDDLVVIVAGYTKLMEVFFQSNPGLKSRFNIFIEFGDYDADELTQILQGICLKNDYKISTDLEEQIRQHFSWMIANRDENFANGRLARNIYDDLVLNHARRISSINNPSDEDLSLFLPIDLKK